MDKEKILQIFTVISIIVLVVFMLWYMIGDSPTFEQLLFLLAVPFLGALFGAYEKLNNKMDNNYNKLSGRIDNLYQECGSIQQALGRIEGRLGKIEGKLDK